MDTSESTSRAKSTKEKVALSYELIRKADKYQTLFHLWYTLGIQSNVAVGAQYSSTETHGELTRPILFKALKSVVSQHPALGIVGIKQASEKKDGNHRLWEARLPYINLEDCVEFIEGDGDLSLDLPRLLEQAHNNWTWFQTGDTTKPWWRVLVYNKSFVIFVFHHAIGDGLSACAFHRSLLAALNQPQSESELETTGIEMDKPTIVATSSNEPIPQTLSEIHDKFRLLPALASLFGWVFLRKFVSRKYFFFSDAPSSRKHPTIHNPWPVEDRTVTKVQILRIDNTTMGKCLTACRSNDASFSALLHTLIKITLAADIYPRAKLGFSGQLVNVRPLRKPDPDGDVFTNATSHYYTRHWLGIYRSAGRKANPAAAIWQIAMKYKRKMNENIQSRAILQGLLGGEKFMGCDDEEIGASFSGQWCYNNQSFSLSNLGVLDQRSLEGRWRIDDVVFSGGVSKASVSCAGIHFYVASVKGGDCVVSAVSEKGIMKDDTVKRVLEGVERRLKLLL